MWCIIAQSKASRGIAVNPTFIMWFVFREPNRFFMREGQTLSPAGDQFDFWS